MGLPQIKIIFQRLGSNIIKRSQRGIVLLILKDDTPENSYELKSYEEATKIKFKAENKDYIKQVFSAGTNKVIVQVIKSNRTLDKVLTESKFIFYNWLAMPDAEDNDNEKIVAQIKAQRSNNRMRKAVLANKPADDKAIVNFTTEDIQIRNSKKKYSAKQYTPRIAGILASISLKESITYSQLPEVEFIKEIEDPDAAIEKGELILINDGRKIKVGTGVNSLTTIPEDDPNIIEDMKKIKMIEGMDLIRTDIHDTFEDHYVGKYANSYDNKVLFFSNVNNYFDALKKDDILNPDYPAYIDVDVEAHKDYLKKQNKDIDKYTMTQLKKIDTGATVYASGEIKLLDAMENFTFKINM